MAIFIPGWTRVSGAQVHIKHTLKALDDSYVVRRPLRAETPGADFYVEHAAKGWLALSVVTTRFEEIDPGGLLDSAARDAFVSRLRVLSELGTSRTHRTTAMSTVVVLWACSTEQASALMHAYLNDFGVRFYSKERFMRLGAKLVDGLLTPLPRVAVQTLLATYFPEAEIPLACTARRRFERDNRADLPRVDEAGYLGASRAGRGFGLRGAERSQVWAIHERVSRRLAAAGVRSWSALPRDICSAPDKARERLQVFDHVLIDEAQFFAPSWFQVVKLSMPQEGQLFLCADPNQGFMKSRLSWKRVGLEVAGRTKKLRKSYRTSRELLQAADSLLATIGRPDVDDYLQPDFDDMRTGVKPVLVRTSAPQDSLDQLVNNVRALDAQAPGRLDELLVIHGGNGHRNGLRQALSKLLGPGKVWALNEPDQKREPPDGHGKDYLRLVSLDSATGLEGSVVFLVGVEDLFTAAEAEGLEDEARDELREECARKLYMAMTRAAHRLVLLSSQPLPAAAQALFHVVDAKDAFAHIGREEAQAESQ